MFHRGEQKPKGRTGVGDLHTNWHITPELEGLHPSMKMNFRGNSEETKNWGSSEFPRNILTEFRGNLSPSEYSEEIPRNNVFLGKNR
ncbi:hypothetical protein Bca101_088201 [Brassica carinata]